MAGRGRIASQRQEGMGGDVSSDASSDAKGVSDAGANQTKSKVGNAVGDGWGMGLGAGGGERTSLNTRPPHRLARFHGYRKNRATAI